MKKILFGAGIVVNLWMLTTLYYPGSPLNGPLAGTIFPLTHAVAIAWCILGISDED